MNPPKILIAAVPGAADEIATVFAEDGLRFSVAESFEDAISLLRREPYDLVIVGYYFDSAQPFRLISHIRAEINRHLPIILLRALSLGMAPGAEADVRAAYKAFGADEFINFRDLADREGLEAARRPLREAVLARLPR